MPNIIEKEDIALFKQKALKWAQSYNTFCYLDSNAYTAYQDQSFESILAIGAIREITVDDSNCLPEIQAFYDKEANNNWLFGYLSYDIKNEIETLGSNNPDNIQFPLSHFFLPEHLIVFTKTSYKVLNSSLSAENLIKQINRTALNYKKTKPFNLKSRIKKEDYLNKVKEILSLIKRGYVYEVNFCQEFYAKNAVINPIDLFQKINNNNKAPFSSLYKLNDKYLLSTSPERYIRKQDNTIISQPIKGTIARSLDKVSNNKLIAQLQNDNKEKAENVMIVDIVRNDLTKIAQATSVKVKEFLKPYTFEKVNHLISTITATIDEQVTFTEIIKATFPMGSMTGAPKKAAMEYIEQFEETKRGLFSGTVGYIQPNGDFDFNVIIRSILYNEMNKYLSVQVGGAITHQSIAEKEYEECIIKIKGLLEIIENKKS